MKVFQGLTTHAKIVVAVLVTAVIAGGGPVLAHGVEHALFAHNADKIDNLNSTALRSKVVQAALHRNSMPADKTGRSIATATISVPNGGGALVSTGFLDPDFATNGSIGTIYIQVGQGCGAGGGDAWWDTYSTWATSASTTVTQKVNAGSHTVQLCGIAAEPAEGRWQDTSIPFVGGGLTVRWHPVAGTVATLGRFGSVTTPPTLSASAMSADARAAALDRKAQRTK